MKKLKPLYTLLSDFSVRQCTGKVWISSLIKSPTPRVSAEASKSKAGVHIWHKTRKLEMEFYTLLMRV